MHAMNAKNNLSLFCPFFPDLSNVAIRFEQAAWEVGRVSYKVVEFWTRVRSERLCWAVLNTDTDAGNGSGKFASRIPLDSAFFGLWNACTCIGYQTQQTPWYSFLIPSLCFTPCVILSNWVVFSSCVFFLFAVVQIHRWCTGVRSQQCSVIQLYFPQSFSGLDSGEGLLWEGRWPA